MLCARLATDATQVKYVSGTRISVLFEALTVALACLAIALYTSWKITLVLLSFVPLMILAGMTQGRVSSGKGRYSANEDEADLTSQHAQEYLRNIKSVTNLGLQEYSYQKFVYLTRPKS